MKLFLTHYPQSQDNCWKRPITVKPKQSGPCRRMKKETWKTLPRPMDRKWKKLKSFLSFQPFLNNKTEYCGFLNLPISFPKSYSKEQSRLTRISCLNICDRGGLFWVLYCKIITQWVIISTDQECVRLKFHFSKIEVKIKQNTIMYCRLIVS